MTVVNLDQARYVRSEKRRLRNAKRLLQQGRITFCVALNDLDTPGEAGADLYVVEMIASDAPDLFDSVREWLLSQCNVELSYQEDKHPR
jgi:hypothetical protein